MTSKQFSLDPGQKACLDTVFVTLVSWSAIIFCLQVLRESALGVLAENNNSSTMD